MLAGLTSAWQSPSCKQCRPRIKSLDQKGKEVACPGLSAKLHSHSSSASTSWSGDCSKCRRCRIWSWFKATWRATASISLALLLILRATVGSLNTLPNLPLTKFWKVLENRRHGIFLTAICQGCKKGRPRCWVYPLLVWRLHRRVAKQALWPLVTRPSSRRCQQLLQHMEGQLQPIYRATCCSGSGTRKSRCCSSTCRRCRRRHSGTIGYRVANANLHCGTTANPLIWYQQALWHAIQHMT